MKSTNWLRAGHRILWPTFQRNILKHSCLQQTAHAWPRCCDVLDAVNSSFGHFKIWATNAQRVATCPTRHNRVAKHSQHLVQCFPQQYCDMLRWHVVVRWSGLNPYALGGHFASPDSEFESKMAVAWSRWSCSPKYAAGHGVYGRWIKLRHIPRSLFTKSTFFNNQRHQFATANEFHHEKQTILKNNCYNPFDALL